MPTTCWVPTAVLNGDNTGDNTFSYRQRCGISTGGLSSASLGQIRVRFSLRATNAEAMVLNNVSIGVAKNAVAGTNADFDTVATPVELLFAGAHGFTLPAATAGSKTSDFTNFSCLITNDLIVIFDFNATAGNGGSTVNNGGEGTHERVWSKTGTASYNLSATPTGGGISLASIEGPDLIETQASAGLPPGGQSFDLPLRRVQQNDLRAIDLRTWTSRSIPLLAATQKPSDLGKSYTDRLLPPPWYRDWSTRGSIPLLASTQKPSDLGQRWTERPSLLPSRANTWIETPQIVISTGLPPGETYTDRPQPRLPVGYTWIETLQLGATAAGPLPSYDWQLPPSMVDRAIDLRTWIETPSQPTAAVTLPPGENFTDRPQPLPRRGYTWIETPQTAVTVTLPPGKTFTDRSQPVSWYRDWSQNLLENTLAVAVTYMPAGILEIANPVGYPRQDQTWIQGPAQPSVTVTLPPGENFTDRPQARIPLGYTWIETPPQTSVTVTLPPGEVYTDRSQLRPRIDYTWIATPQPTISGGPLPTYDWQIPPSMVDRAIDLRTWLQTPLQPSVTVTLPPGENFTDRPRPVTWLNTWTFNLQETTLAPTVILPAGKTFTDRPAPVSWYREWLLSLQQTTLTPTVTLPAGEIYTDRPAPVSWYRDWSLNLQTTTLLPPITLPTGEVYTDRPQPVLWFRDWSVNLQATTLAPIVLPVGATFTDLPQRGPPPPVPSWAYFNVNLSQDELPVGAAYTDRPLPVTWYREWLLNLQQSTLAPPPAVFPPGQVYADRPAPISWFRDWTVNLGEFTPVGPDVLPPGQVSTNLPPPPAPQFSRSWESPYNVNLFSPTSFGLIPVRAGAVGRRRRERERPVDPWSKTLTRQHWKELQELIQAEADAAVEAERRDDPALAAAADAAREVAEALYLADETPAVNQDIVRITASLRAGAARRAEMEAEALTSYLAMLEDEAECELLLFS